MNPALSSQSYALESSKKKKDQDWHSKKSHVRSFLSMALRANNAAGGSKAMEIDRWKLGHSWNKKKSKGDFAMKRLHN